MNLTSGKFTAPRPGTYFFSFTGTAQFPASSFTIPLGVGLFLNGGRIGLGYVYEGNTVAGQYEQLIVQSTLNLKSGDQVWMEITAIASGVFLYGDSGHSTHFAGWMLQEEIALSL